VREPESSTNQSMLPALKVLLRPWCTLKPWDKLIPDVVLFPIQLNKMVPKLASLSSQLLAMSKSGRIVPTDSRSSKKISTQRRTIQPTLPVRTDFYLHHPNLSFSRIILTEPLVWTTKLIIISCQLITLVRKK
jgi:hypothetical protein